MLNVWVHTCACSRACVIRSSVAITSAARAFFSSCAADASAS